MTCGKGTRTHPGSDCMQPSTVECTATLSCMITEHSGLLIVAVVDGNLHYWCRLCNTFGKVWHDCETTPSEYTEISTKEKSDRWKTNQCQWAIY